ncbi:amidase signature domain-containing protein [Lineolata rhizophorae]|uniref:Amidase signature domain-containing protein n=1 Tax=Lineolata rhizophorae TaxID=578093 RepID=A0A6A6PEC9_9PEZI|nr:amidase signature domain-containing protein [Lineolata rhizophorae]
MKLQSFFLISFDPREASISSIQHAIFTGATSCRSVVSAHLSRALALNNHTNALIALFPDALDRADELDDVLAAGNATTGLHLFCVPLVLKDNFDFPPLPTTGGSRELTDSYPAEPAPVAAALADAGAVMLAKANLHELALEGLSVSGLGGQTVNPYDSTRTPGGSSGGTGAAVAASFAIAGTGTDTVNSLRNPAASCNLVSFRPTRGLLTRAGVLPVSYTQDTVGMIARNLEDLALLLSVMAEVGYDAADNVTALAPAWARADTDYASGIKTGSLEGKRLGLVQGFFNRTEGPETDPVNDVFDELIPLLESEGATIVNITEDVYNSSAISSALDTQRYEFRQVLTEYLSSDELSGDHPTSAEDFYDSGEFLVIPSEYEYVNTALVSSTSNATYPDVQYGIYNLTLALKETFAANELDAFIYPEQKNLVVPIGSPSQSGRNGILAALTGSPVVVVRAGFSPPTDTAPIGVPVGMEILGMPWAEPELLKIAYQVDLAVKGRRAPEWARQEVEVMTFEDGIPDIYVNDTIPPEYSIGEL